MSNMQIDFPSPSLIQSTAQKRPRSLVRSPSPSERPTKRVSTDPESANRTPSPAPGNIEQHLSLRTHPNLQLPSSFELRPPEDWVAKTSGLKLDSPLISYDYTQVVPELMYAREAGIMNNSTHETMLTDTYQQSHYSTEQWGSQQTAPSHVPFTTTQTPFSSPQSYPQPVLPPLATDLPRQGIHIHVQPATPSNRTPGHSRINDPNRMSVSPSTSRVWPPSGPSARKTRVMMGPRPDCEKCKMGVKGHWMHID